MKLDRVEYNNSAKNSWRARVWSTIRKFRGASLQTDTLLYLPGEYDLDSSLAERSGIKPYNMVAIERNAVIAERLRRQGRIVINACLDEVVFSWPENWYVGVIIADLQCGYEDWVNRMCLHWRSSKPFKNGVMVVNVQKGRESTNSRFNQEERFIKDVDGRHSGTYGKTYWLNNDEQAWQPRNRALTIALDCYAGPKKPLDDKFNASMISMRYRLLPDYKSGRVLMQSVVMQNTPISVYSNEYLPPDKDAKIQRFISAARALRTMQEIGFLSMKRVT